MATTATAATTARDVKKVVIVGGVAGGMSCAMRLRRLREDLDIHVYERTGDISIASCGMPYYVAGEITDRKKMAIVNPPWAAARHNVAVHTFTEVTSVDRNAKTVSVRNVQTGAASTEHYDRLVLCPGAAPITGDIAGTNLPNVLSLRTLPDMDKVAAAVDRFQQSGKKGSAVVIGASFIGLEVVEALSKRGVETTVCELAPQVLPVLDPEMTVPLKAMLESRGVHVLTCCKPKAIEQSADGRLSVVADVVSAAPQPQSHPCETRSIAADLVVVAIGVRPESKLAKDAGLELGVAESIVVNEHMQTSDPNIYACGDVVQSKNAVLGVPMVLALAGPAVRQARAAAAHITGMGSDVFKGVVGTAIVRVFDLTAACVGASEKMLCRCKTPNVGKLYLYTANKVEWYPTFSYLLFKMMYDTKTGKILGAQIVGRDGVDKRIDVLSVAIQNGMTVRQLAQVELAYSPQYNGPKDILNVAGFAASNSMDGLATLTFPNCLPEGHVILDVREEAELKAQGEFPGAIWIPCGQLRNRLAELPRDKPIVVACKVGLRGNHVTRMLMQNGFKSACNLSGGYMAWTLFHDPSRWVRFLETKIF